MRADARRNRSQLLEAAVEVILEVGGEPTRDEVARRAGVGIATLYRHFPDQQSLLREVALHVLDATIEDGEALLAESAAGSEALRSYAHRAVDNGLGALNLVHRLLDDTHWPAQRERADAVLNGLLSRAQDRGEVRRDVTAQDVALAILRACRPLAIGISGDEERRLAHRHVDIFVDGLCEH